MTVLFCCYPIKNFCIRVWHTNVIKSSSTYRHLTPFAATKCKYRPSGDTCSWKGQLEKTRSWKVRYEIGKIEVGKFGPKLEHSRRSWKVRAEVGKYNWSWNVTAEVGKFWLNLERNNEVGKLLFELEKSKRWYGPYKFITYCGWIQSDWIHQRL